MLIKLKDINESPSNFSFRLPRSIFLRLEDKFRFEEMSCEASLRKNQDTIVIKGSYKVVLHSECDLCLAPAAMKMERRFELTLTPEHSQIILKNDQEISLSAPDVEYYKKEEISLDRHFEDQLLLDMPLLISCSEECQGLCCGCGVNLNDETCQCKSLPNNPFYVLSQLEN